jgi:hypothetical protein
MTVFSGQKCVFKQKSVPAQKVKPTREWLQRSLLAFISSAIRLVERADLKTLDYKLWAVLEDMVCRKRHYSLDNLRGSLMKAVAENQWRLEHTVTAEWPESLKPRVEA